MTTTESTSFWVETEDWHTAGEPFRIVKDLPKNHAAPGETVSQRRLNIIRTPGHPIDTLRKSLCHEPRGHSDMYGGFIMPPNDNKAHFGVLFFHRDGFSTACGHGTIALGHWAVTKGIVRPTSEDGEVDVVVDVPSGRVVAKVTVKQGKPVHADFVNVASYQFAKQIPLTIESIGKTVNVDLSFGGAVFASVSVDQLDRRIAPANVDVFVKLQREIRAALGEKAHHGLHDLSGVVFFQEAENSDNEVDIVQQRSVTIYADGQIDRSPCGSGTTARLAILFAQGRLGPKRGKFLHRSIIDTLFEGGILEEVKSPVAGFPACIPRVRGHANLVGNMRFFIDCNDPVFPGFILE